MTRIHVTQITEITEHDDKRILEAYGKQFDVTVYKLQRMLSMQAVEHATHFNIEPKTLLIRYNAETGSCAIINERG